MNWLLKVFGLYKKNLDKQNHIGNVCPCCKRKGYPTSLIAGRSFACKNQKCKIWWANPY